MLKLRKTFGAAVHDPRKSQKDTLTAMVLETYAQIPATAAVANLPEQVFVIHVDNHGATLLHPDKTKNLSDLITAARDLQSDLADSEMTGRTLCNFDEMNPEKRFLVINTAGKFHLLSPEHDLAHSYDHELAHAIIRDGLYGGKSAPAIMNTAECVADAYAALRLYQRFGKAVEKDIHDLIEARTLHLVFEGAQTHFTAPVLEKIIEHNETIDYAALSPQETLDLARRFALLYAPNPGLADRLENTFASFLKGATPDQTEKLFPFATAILETPFPPVFKYGSTAISALLSGKFRWGEETVRLEGAAWDNVRKKLATRLEKFEAEGEMFGLNLPKQKRPAP